MRVRGFLFVFALGAVLHGADADTQADPKPVVAKAESRAAEQKTELTFVEGEPIIVRADITIPDGAHEIRWRVRGDVEYETFERDTILVIGWKPGEYEAEFLFIDYEAKTLVEEQFIVVVQGPRPPPVVPDDPVNPDVDVVTKGTVYSIILRDAEKLTADQSQTMLEIRDWADQHKDVEHFEFDVDAENPDGTTNETVREYVDKVPGGAQYPFGFLVQRDASGAAVVKWSGTLGTASETIKRIEGIR